jgi:tetratricopeptide (TPR) repeat protein
LLLVAWRRRPHSRPTTATLVLATVLALLPAALASWHNSTQLGRLAGPSLNGGLNLFLGQTSTDGFFPVLPGLDLQDDPAGRDFLATRLGQEVPDAGAADRRWWAAAVARAREAPLAAAGGWALKMWRHLQDVPVAQVTPLAFWPAEAPVLRGLVVPWGLLVAAALAGMVAALAARRPPARRDDPDAAARAAAGTAPAAARDLAARLLPWLLAAGLLVAVQSLFFVVTRYRLVLVPLLAVAAGLGGLAAWSLVRQRAWARLGVVAGAVLAAVLVVQPWGLAAEQARRQGLEGANLARRLLVLAEAAPAPTGRAGPTADHAPPLRRRAETLLADATAVAPGQTDLWRLRVVNLHRLGRTRQALGVLTRGTMRAADPRPLALLRVGLLRSMGRLDEAEAQLQAELRATPDDPDLLHDLAVLRGQRGRWRAAAAAARRLQAAAPADARGWLDLAVAQARLGDRTAAVRTLRAGMGQVTDDQGRALLAENLRRLADGSGAPPDTGRAGPPPPPR